MFTATYQVVVLALATAAISTTISKGRIFASAREWIIERNEWLGKLVSCSYCTSHWVALAFVAIYRPVLIQQWFIVDLFVSVFSVVAISAVVSGVIIKLTPWQQQPSPADEPDDEVDQEVEQLSVALQAARDKIVEQSKTIKELQQ
ncbi:MAG: DUF1360 domain-containing protein [Candidatus Vogelbacteria bacterium]|nr:DUF1360 domain-containing protein [Candidatus Vogelbacteria bacterium]